MKPDEVLIREAILSDAAALRELRLEGLRNEPVAFASDYEEEAARPLAHTEEQLRERSDGTIFVAEMNSAFVGMAGIGQERHAKQKHNAILWGVYVQPAWRGKKIAAMLLDACIDWARGHAIQKVKLWTAASNTAAITAYVRRGFLVYGMEPRAIYHDGVYYDDLLMMREL